MTTHQNFTGRKQHHMGSAPFSRFIEDLLNTNIGEAIENAFVANRAFVNVLESDAAFEVHVAAPGLSKSDFKLSVKEGALHVSAAKGTHTQEGKTFRSKEFDFGNFQRIFRLDERVDADKINAKYENGVLIVSLPKKAKDTDKKEIHVD
jgi:HSP20 family protein